MPAMSWLVLSYLLIYRILNSAGFILMLQIDSATTAIACMGNTKNQVQAHLREAWLAIPEAQRKERLEPLLAHQTNPDKLITLAAEKGLPQEQLPAMQGTRTDWRSDATRGARTQLNAQASNAGGRDGGYARIKDYPSCDTGELDS